MSRATSSSSRSSWTTARRVSEGVPRRCWCGDSIKTYVSKTDDNPYRRFYRCENAIQRKGEDHLLDGKHNRIVEDLNDLKKAMAENLKATNDMVAKLKGEMKEKVEEKVKAELNLYKVCLIGFVGGAIAWLLLSKTLVG